MRINLTSVFVDDQDNALRFYTEVLGFVKKTEIPLGEDRWLTVVSPDDPDGVELLLEPDGHPAAKPFKEALVDDGIPFTSFAVETSEREYAGCATWACGSPRSPSNGPRDHRRLRRHLRQPDPDRQLLISATRSMLRRSGIGAPRRRTLALPRVWHPGRHLGARRVPVDSTFVAGLIGALIGALTNIGTLIVQNIYQSRRDMIRLVFDTAYKDYELRIRALPENVAAFPRHPRLPPADGAAGREGSADSRLGPRADAGPDGHGRRGLRGCRRGQSRGRGL